MFDDVQAWWENAHPETQAALLNGSLAAVALLGGWFLGTLAIRALRAKHFDEALRVPGPPRGLEASHGITPSLVAGVLVRLTVWAWAVCFVARQYGRVEVAEALSLVMSRTWAVAGVLVAALTVGRLLAQRLVDCLQGLP